MKWEDIEPSVKKDRQTTIYIRGLKKRIAVLEQKLLSIREMTNLFDRGVAREERGGLRLRQQWRIDNLEAKLLVIRELSSMAAANEQKGGDASRRQIVESRIRRGGLSVSASEAGPHANLDTTLGDENIQLGNDALEKKGLE